MSRAAPPLAKTPPPPPGRAIEQAARIDDDEAGRLPVAKAAEMIFLLALAAWAIFISAGIGLLVA